MSICQNLVNYLQKNQFCNLKEAYHLLFDLNIARIIAQTIFFYSKKYLNSLASFFEVFALDFIKSTSSLLKSSFFIK